MQRGSTRPQRAQNSSNNGNTAGNVTRHQLHQQQQQTNDNRPAIIREKEQELCELSKIKKQSEELVQFFEELQKNMHNLADDVKGTADTLTNWNHVFRIMASTEDEGQDASPMFVRMPMKDPQTSSLSSSSSSIAPSSSSTPQQQQQRSSQQSQQHRMRQRQQQ